MQDIHSSLTNCYLRGVTGTHKLLIAKIEIFMHFYSVVCFPSIGKKKEVNICNVNEKEHTFSTLYYPQNDTKSENCSEHGFQRETLRAKTSTPTQSHVRSLRDAASYE